MSSFSSLNLGSRAVFAAQRGLDITGQNIANSATPGYSRQRVDQVAVGGPTVPAIWAKYDGAGGGVKVTGISRMRDEFLEARARTAHQTQGSYTEQQKVYEAIERTINEPSTNGLQKRLGEFWNSWSGIANDVTGGAPRELTVQKAQSVVNQFNTMGNQLATQWNDARTEYQANVDDVNAMAKDVARLNRAIKNNVVNGLPANELADQRDVLVEKITTLTGGTAERAADGVVNISLGTPPTKNYLVSDRHYAQIQATDGGAGNPSGPTPNYDPTAPGHPAEVGLSWKQGLTDVGDPFATPDPVPNPATVPAGTGTLAGQQTNMNQTIPGYIDQLNGVAQKFADQVNNTLSGATDGKPAYTAKGVAAQPMFTSDGASVTTGITAGNLKLPAGFTSDDLGISEANWSATGALDGNKALAMAQRLQDKGGADESYRGLVTRLGTEAQSINRNKDAADNVAKTADDARESVSGVSLNEEMTNLIQYQHSFEAAAKFITAVDATIESLLNMTR